MKITQLAGASLVSALFLVPAAAPAQQLAAPDLVPANPSAVLSIHDVNGMWEAIEGTPVRSQIDAILLNPSIRKEMDLDEIKAAMADASDEVGTEITFENIFGNILKGVDFYAAQEASTGELGFVANTTLDSEQRATEWLQLLEDHYKPEEGQTVDESMLVQRRAVSGREILILPHGDGFATTDGARLIFSSSMDVIATTLRSSGLKSIQNAPGFAEDFAHIQDHDGELWLWLDGETFGDASDDILGEIGMDESPIGGSMVMSIDFETDRLDIRSFLGKEETGATAELFETPASAQSDILAYGGPEMMAAMSWNILRPEVLYRIAQENGEGEQMKTEFESDTGMSFEEDLLPAFGNQFAVFLGGFSFMNFSNIDVDLSFVLQAADKAKAMKITDALVDQMMEDMTNPDGTPVERTEEIYQGSKVYSIPIPNAPPGFALSYAMTQDNFLVFSLSTESTKAALDRGAAKAGLNTAADWQRAHTIIPNEANQLYRVDLRQIVFTLQGILPMFAGMSGASQDDISVMTLVLDLIGSFGTGYMAVDHSPAGHDVYATFLM